MKSTAVPPSASRGRAEFMRAIRYWMMREWSDAIDGGWVGIAKPSGTQIDLWNARRDIIMNSCIGRYTPPGVTAMWNYVGDIMTSSSRINRRRLVSVRYFETIKPRKSIVKRCSRNNGYDGRWASSFSEIRMWYLWTLSLKKLVNFSQTRLLFNLFRNDWSIYRLIHV